MLHRLRRGLRFGALLSLVGIVLSAIHAAISSHTLGSFARWIGPGFFNTAIDFAVSSGHATVALAEEWIDLWSSTGQSLTLSLAAGLATATVAAVTRAHPPRTLDTSARSVMIISAR